MTIKKLISLDFLTYSASLTEVKIHKMGLRSFYQNLQSYLLMFLFMLIVLSCKRTIKEEYVNTLGITMVPIQSGRFLMGQERNSDLPLTLTYGDRYFMGGEIDEQPVHRVTISYDFYMSATQVTNSQYEQFDPEHRKYRGRMGLSYGDDDAVVFVSWYDAVAFTEWLSEKEGKPYRLPTEAEWEYACRAGTTTVFNTGDSLPEVFHKSQYNKNLPEPVSTFVGQTPANTWGLFDMHGNVEEWCLDWYGSYEQGRQKDPVGRESGLFKVTRGGSHNVYLKSLRSANRMSTLPENKHWLIGFRVVQVPMPKSTPLEAEGPALHAQNVNQEHFDWEGNKKDGQYFKGPVRFVIKPDNPGREKFLFHNHLPSVTWCDNGNLIASWYNCARERGRETALVASRYRVETGEWDKASEFFNARGRNNHGIGLFNAGDGKLINLNGMGTDGWWYKQALVRRFSEDNGATWSKPEIVDPSHGQIIPHMCIFRLQNGNIIFPADAHDGTGLYMSPDNGESWELITSDEPNGSIRGIHAGVAELNDGRIMAFGRGQPINGRMPISISEDGGLTWSYKASGFPPTGGGQKPVLIRLNEGALVLFSFTDLPNFQTVEVNNPRPRMMSKNGIVVKDASGAERTVYGMYAAVSLDDGKTWPYKKLVSNFGTGEIFHGEGWTQRFIMDETRGEPLGYLTCTQTPDNIIHLLSSGLHYQFNLEWLKEPMPAASNKVMTFFMSGRYPAGNGLENQPGILGMEFISDKNLFRQIDASSIVETTKGLVVSWQGSLNDADNMGIWLSRLTPEGWSHPVEVATSNDTHCWNPVLFKSVWGGPREKGPLYLFYKVGSNPGNWCGVVKASYDQGKTWSEEKFLPEGFLGPIKNKPIGLQDETILFPSSKEDHGGRVFFEKFWYNDGINGRWEKIGPIHDSNETGSSQPAILTHFSDNPDRDKIQALCRSSQGVVTEAWSSNRGATWGGVTPTSLPNPDSAIDAITLSNGMHLIVYNHATSERDTDTSGLESLNVAVSEDGITWEAALVLEKTENSEFSNPAVIQTADDLVHITYSWNQIKVKHVVIDPAILVSRSIVGGVWPE